MDLTTDISPIQFEELCYELLNELGFLEISWRKGTSMDASPADQGRDIEATLRRKDIDGSQVDEKWFIECKSYKKGVPPQALQGALAWAESSSPHTLLIAVSGFLSNPAKEHLKEYQRNRNPPFRIRLWEAPDFQRMLFGRAKLLNKYNLASSFPLLEILHPAHKQFLTQPPFNTVDYFLSLLDDLDPSQRNGWFYGAYVYVINPPMEQPVSGDQVMGELVKSPVSYYEFKRALKVARKYVGEMILVHGVVSNTLSHLLHRGDLTAIQERRDYFKWMISYFEKRLETHPKQRKSIEGCIEETKSWLPNVEENLESGYESYCSFCDTILIPLFDQKFDAPEPPDDDAFPEDS